MGSAEKGPRSATEVGKPRQIFREDGSETHQEDKMLESKLFLILNVWKSVDMDNKKSCYYFLFGALPCLID